jgi:hypothetical protein
MSHLAFRRQAKKEYMVLNYRDKKLPALNAKHSVLVGLSVPLISGR